MYDYDRSVKKAKENNLRFIQFNVKKSDKGIHLDIGCPEGRPDNKFLKQSLGFVMKYICKVTPSNFKSHNVGNMFISILAKFDPVKGVYEFTIESFTYAGLTRDEIYCSLEEPFIKVY